MGQLIVMPSANPRTSKSWNDFEESAFAAIMNAGLLERLPAIRLYRRCKSDLARALVLAAQGRPSDSDISRRKALADRVRARNRAKVLQIAI